MCVDIGNESRLTTLNVFLTEDNTKNNLSTRNFIQNQSKELTSRNKLVSFFMILDVVSLSYQNSLNSIKWLRFRKSAFHSFKTIGTYTK